MASVADSPPRIEGRDLHLRSSHGASDESQQTPEHLGSHNRRGPEYDRLVAELVAVGVDEVAGDVHFARRADLDHDRWNRQTRRHLVHVLKCDRDRGRAREAAPVGRRYRHGELWRPALEVPARPDVAHPAPVVDVETTCRLARKGVAEPTPGVLIRGPGRSHGNWPGPILCEREGVEVALEGRNLVHILHGHLDLGRSVESIGVGRPHRELEVRASALEVLALPDVSHLAHGADGEKLRPGTGQRVAEGAVGVLIGGQDGADHQRPGLVLVECELVAVALEGRRLVHIPHLDAHIHRSREPTRIGGGHPEGEGAGTRLEVLARAGVPEGALARDGEAGHGTRELVRERDGAIRVGRPRRAEREGS